MQGRHTCVGCGRNPPETDSFTLISAQFGWRLTRQRQPDGTTVTEWRCPKCWLEHKRARGTGGSGSNRPGDPEESTSLFPKRPNRGG